MMYQSIITIGAAAPPRPRRLGADWSDILLTPKAARHHGSACSRLSDKGHRHDQMPTPLSLLHTGLAHRSRLQQSFGSMQIMCSMLHRVQGGRSSECH